MHPNDLSNVLVGASGTETDGGTGFEKLVEGARSGIFRGNIVGVFSQYPNGGVRKKADLLGIPFIHFRGPNTAETYRRVVAEYNAKFVLLSGYTLPVKGINPACVVNIHPAPLPEYGGKGWFGHVVHERVLAAYKAGKLRYSAVTMHFATARYDDGPVIFEQLVDVYDIDTANDLAWRVRAVEHRFQALVSDLVVIGQIVWDGVDPKSLRVPRGYAIHRPPHLAEYVDLIF